MISFAVCTNQLEMVEFLYNNGACLKVEDRHGESLWHFSIIYEFPEMFDLLTKLWLRENHKLEVRNN